MDIGVDTHKQTHVLVAIDEAGRPGGSRTIANTPEGWATALQWARGQQQQQTRWGVENSGSPALSMLKDEKRAGGSQKQDLARPSGKHESLIWADMPAAKS